MALFRKMTFFFADAILEIYATDRFGITKIQRSLTIAGRSVDRVNSQTQSDDSPTPLVRLRNKQNDAHRIVTCYVFTIKESVSILHAARRWPRACSPLRPREIQSPRYLPAVQYPNAAMRAQSARRHAELGTGSLLWQPSAWTPLEGSRKPGRLSRAAVSLDASRGQP